jgi:hypothetical protein
VIYSSQIPTLWFHVSIRPASSVTKLTLCLLVDIEIRVIFEHRKFGKEGTLGSSGRLPAVRSPDCQLISFLHMRHREACKCEKLSYLY